jgi:bacteriocin biosynthesis cyclodehydratase domain-containing protein
MDIRFDPRLPLVWRDPHTLQIGVDRPAVVLSGVSGPQERLVAAIASGHGRSGLGALAERARCSEGEAAALVAAVAPALVTHEPASALRVAVTGSSPLLDAIVALLTGCGLSPEHVDAESVGSRPAPALGVAVSHHVHDPQVTGAWLRRDVPHLCVVVGDRSTRVGPIVVPGATACAHCLDLHRSRVDPGWGVIAGQLWGRSPTVEGPIVVADVAARAARRVRDRLLELSRDSLRVCANDSVIDTVDHDTGRVTSTVSRPHPGCGCAALPRSGWVDDPIPRDLDPRGSRRAEDVLVLA